MNAFNEHGEYSWADQSNFVKCGLAVDSINTYRVPVKYVFVMGEGEIESTSPREQHRATHWQSYANQGANLCITRLAEPKSTYM